MDGFAPGLREAVLALGGPLRAVAYFVCVAGLMLRVHRGRSDIDGWAPPLVRAMIVVALVALLPEWFEMLERLFLGVADTVQAGYSNQPMRAATLIREATTQSDTHFALLRLGESLYRAVLWATAKLVIMIGTLVQLPFLLLQHVLTLLCYLFLPVALAAFMVPALQGLALRYVQQTCAVLAWPIGFAVTELVAFNLITAYVQNLVGAYPTADGGIDPSSYASVLGGVLGSLWLLVGTVATPFLMQALFCAGSPLNAGGQSALSQAYAFQQVTYLLAMLKTGGASGALAAMRAGGGAGAAGGAAMAGGASTLPPPPPPFSPGIVAPPRSEEPPKPHLSI